ncbi:hypothetical protein N7491_001351 [Penicillium cf. griseofulvum]|nr:hypothetical protein N7491_001351 [Penicillium cf. griseofulvum]
MGFISQYYLPPRPRFGVEANTEMISFFTRTGDERMLTSFADLGKKLWELGDCPQLVWGKTQSNEEENDNILLFLDVNGDIVYNMSHRKIVGPWRLDILQNMEITTFDVPANDLRSFEYAHRNFTHTTHQQHFPQSVLSPYCSIMPASQGWQAETVQFISILRCNKDGAREEWYSDFAKRARTEYDLLGHIVDWLRTLSTNISVQYVPLEMEDPWMTADKLEKDKLAKEARKGES